MANLGNFQNRRISPKFGFSKAAFLRTTTLILLYNSFLKIFANFNFTPKLAILQRL